VAARGPARRPRLIVPLTRLTIESIAAGGDGIGRAAGLAVFVPRTAPRDVVDVEMQSRGRFARGRLVRLAHPSPDRVEPACEHFREDACGGCQLQHLSYDAQLVAKQRMVRDAFARIARRTVDVPAVHPSPSPWRYRRKLTLALRRDHVQWRAGLHAFDDPDRVFALRDCPITDARVVAAWHAVLGAAHHLPRARTLRGAIRLASDGPVLSLEGASAWPTAHAFADAAPALAAIWWTPDHGERRLLVDRRRTGAPDAAFVQVNPEVATQLHERLLERAWAHAPRTAIDAYAGLGDTARRLAERGVQVTAVERDADAAAWAARSLSAPSGVVAARVEDAIESLLPVDVVVLNPPRQGLDARVALALEAAHPRPRAVLYVSCDPATLARDVGRLVHYRVASLEAFDMFPQTAHVECLCELVPEAA
jgi:23S rRNA (uracil1939-C5)-methyltransferase